MAYEKPSFDEAEDEEELDWNPLIKWEDVPEYIVLNPGNYKFTVNGFKRGHYDGNESSGKKGCKTMEVTISIENEKGMATVRNTFYIKKTALGFIRDFFMCIGLMKKGEDFTPDWDKAVGCNGMAKISNVTGKNGKLYNNVDRWIKP